MGAQKQGQFIGSWFSFKNYSLSILETLFIGNAIAIFEKKKYEYRFLKQKYGIKN